MDKLKKKKNLKKAMFFSFGIISLGLAYLGIILPRFPGTPFILLTAFFFIRSSDRMYGYPRKVGQVCNFRVFFIYSFTKTIFLIVVLSMFLYPLLSMI